MLLKYVMRDLMRNPRRTLASTIGLTLGVGLFSSVLFFIDASQATLTSRAIASVVLDMQAVLTTPLGGQLTLRERLSSTDPLAAGEQVRVVLDVVNAGPNPANEVVVNDEPPPPLAYVYGSTELDGKPIPDQGGRIPLAHGLARTGMNLGTIPPRTKVRLTYLARATQPISRPVVLRMQGTISSRENVVPAGANLPARLSLSKLVKAIDGVPGVASADGLSFVDLAPRSLRQGTSTHRSSNETAVVPRRVRVFAFDARYQRHYPSIRTVVGSRARGSALLSAEAAQALGARTTSILLSLPGRRKPLSLRVGGAVDLGRAKPLFASRKSNKFEDFLYVPISLVVPPAIFEHRILPAFRAAQAERGRAIKALPVQEVDVSVDRSRLRSDPASALAQTRSVARTVTHRSRGQVDLIDNVSNALRVATDDAEVGKKMFLFLGLPGALLAAVLAAYAGSILAVTQRREQAVLRLRGAQLRHFRALLAYKTLVLSGVGSIAGVALGVLSTVAVLPRGMLMQVPAGDFGLSAAVSVATGIVLTAASLYVPGRRSMSRYVADERAELATAPLAAWRRWRLDFVLLGAAAVLELGAFASGALDPPITSVSQGQAVALPTRLLPAPVIAWFAGVLLGGRLFAAGAAQLPVPRPPRFGPVVWGTVGRSLRRRAWAAAGGVVCVGLVVAAGTGLQLFTHGYEASKAADSRFVVGSDLRVTPSATSRRPHPPSFGSELRVPGISGVSPVVAELENAVLVGPDNQDRADLTAIDPESFGRVAELSDAFFVGRSAAAALAALAADRHGLLVYTQTADDFGIETGDRVQVLLERGTKHQTLRSFRVVGLFENFPGSPEPTDLVARLDFYDASIGLQRADYFLAAAADSSDAGIRRAVGAIAAGPARTDDLLVESAPTARNEEESSLTSLNVRGLTTLDWVYTLSMCTTAIAIFVFGLMLQRRKEYASLQAQGLRRSQLRSLIFVEAAAVAVSGVAIGITVGSGMGALLMHVLRALFILDPGVSLSIQPLVIVTTVVLGATLVCALVATELLRRRSSELLREE
jgi:putative ABC transport system permease protein